MGDQASVGSSSNDSKLAVDHGDLQHRSSSSSSLRPVSLQRSKTVLVTTDVTRRMVCGGLSGMIAKTATNPLERIKMLSQTGEHGASTQHHRPTVLQLYRNILRNEGVLGLWAGNGANLVRIFPAKAVVFSANDYYRRLLHLVTGTPAHQALSGPLSFLAGGLSGMTATAVTYPMDFARGRISGKLASETGKKTYKGIVQTLILTVKDEGVFALYRGVTPTLIGAMPYEGIKFGTVGLLEKLFPVAHHTAPTSSGDSDFALFHLSTPVRKMLFGGLGGVMAGLITYPNDTVRRLLQLQGSRGTVGQYSGYWDCVRQTYQAHGIRRFYAGLGINLIRMGPNTALQFYFYSLLKEWSNEIF